MEKRKVFKISIIDKEISRTEFDRNTFYTSDSELSLVFKLVERDYSYDHGEILLYNENDKSFVTRPITKKENDFVYELDLDIIPHYGKWKAQLQLVKDGDVYTSKPFDFNIVNDLSNLAPQPTLTDINNWVTLKQSANELIDEMQDIIVDVEHAEFLRENNEKKRQIAELERTNNEKKRQINESELSINENTRKNNELERENNEKKRRISEFERVENETTRQQAEQERQSTFETNEVERQTTFESNESERQSAELIRVENENQRKIDHANRSAELDGKADKVVIKNTVTNGGFNDGLVGWNKVGDPTNFNVVNNELRIIGAPPSASGITQDIQGSIGDKFYIIIHKCENLEGVNIRVFDYGTFNNGEYLYYREIDSRIVSKVNGLRFYIQTISTAPETTNVTIDGVCIINLTQTFGAGNEPTKEEMDELIKITGYIDGEYALNNKEMLVWTLALIRQNKNAIIALGGA